MLIQGPKLIYNTSLTFTTVVEMLDSAGTGFVLVVDDNNTLKGIVTDGDIRRAVLHDIKDLEKIINFKPHFIKEQDIDFAVNYMRVNKIKHLPVLDNENRLSSVYYLSDLEYIRTENPVVLMAGGMGVRLKPLTDNLPKPMLKIGDKPILENVIEQFKSFGFTNFYISVNYLSEKIISYFDNGNKWGINIEYIHENKRMGTAGSLFFLRNVIKTPFIVMNSDLITGLNFKDLLEEHLHQKAWVTMCTKKQSFTVPFGVIESNEDNAVVSIREKPTYTYNINGGIYAMNPHVMELMKEEQFLDMTDLLKKLSDENKLIRKYSINTSWSDIGTLEEYEKINAKFSSKPL